MQADCGWGLIEMKSASPALWLILEHNRQQQTLTREEQRQHSEKMDNVKLTMCVCLREHSHFTGHKVKCGFVTESSGVYVKQMSYLYSYFCLTEPTSM